jgi:hypothetical protein
VVRDHTSCLRHIEARYGLAPLNMRDGAVGQAAGVDALGQIGGGAAAPIQLPAVEIDENMLPAACDYGGQFTAQADHDVLEWADANRAKLGRLDRRGHALDDVYDLAAYLDRHGLGRIRRGR